jgi:hypothetical protein
VLRDVVGTDGPALRAIAEIVHDIDRKDVTLVRAEAEGARLVIDGICAITASDEERIARGGAIFDELHAHFRTRRR